MKKGQLNIDNRTKNKDFVMSDVGIVAMKNGYDSKRSPV